MTHLTDISVKYIKGWVNRYIMTRKRGYLKERIIRTILNHPSGDLSKYRLAKEAEASYPWTHEYLTTLEREGYVEGTAVSDYRGLLDHWRDIRKKPRKRDYMVQDPLSLLRASDLSYVLTSYQAENLVQGYLFPSRIDLYIKEEDSQDWHGLMRENGLVGRGNVRTLIDDGHVFYGNRVIDDLWMVSTPQLIIDLLSEGGPSVEAAELLIEKAVLQLVQ